SLEQVESERILKIKISKKIDEDKFEKYYLILELFAPGNIILTNNDLLIINMLKRKKFKDRKIIIKEKYELPPQKEISIFNINEKKLLLELKKSELDIVKFLAIKMGTGGKFSEEICEIADIDKNLKSNILNENQIKKIILSIHDVLNKKIEAYLLKNENDYLDFMPFEFKSNNTNKEKVISFNEAIEKYYSSFKNEIDLREKEFLIEVKKLQNILNKQEIQKEKILEGYEKNNNLGNKIYENYGKIEEILNSINNAAKKKGWDEVLLTIKNSEELSKLIKKIDYKNNQIVLNID
ncbi:MAG: NFACT family protein, partial [Nanoarchaeota archaeon]|nr:NFACT family protein [Nanoarchaeota archaeon]